ncbi:unnamed protein product [Leptosia nina]|uniref:trypsin n=1 Tax=Leptosia nina TaxID=320188 RepID=A0AAV1JF91_9NEOP
MVRDLARFFATGVQESSMILRRRIPVPDTKIIGGSTAPDGGIPYQVSLRHDEISHFCGATLLAKRWILTAAHCGVAYPKEVVTAVVGTNSLVKGGDKYKVEDIIIHEKYNATAITNDISLVKAAEYIKFSERVQPINLPNRAPRPGDNILVSGWGKESEGDEPIPANLQIVNQTVIAIDTCKIIFTGINTVYDTELCTLTVSGSGACQGDSGGPLVLNNQIVGVVSWGVACDLWYPDVSTNVFYYRKWIENYLNY